MQNGRIDFTIQNAGCLIWLAPRSLGGVSPEQFGQIWMGEGDENVQDLVARGAFIGMSLYQDDGYNVRFVVGDLTPDEEAEWTAHAVWKLDVGCGQVIVSGSLSEDFDDEFAEIEKAVDGGSYWVGCYVEVPRGEYRVDVYSYPPGDLSAGWEHITNTELFGKHPAVEPEEAASYFRRTRPGLEPPAWIKEGYDETSYVNFVVRLSPLAGEVSAPAMEEDGCIEWEFRKPEICPLGIRTNLPADA
jgi:hypothetical protein